jgi:Skp family chaperone for outer membrane proteins
MKIRALVTVLALACGTAFAAQYSGAAEDAANRNQPAAASTDAQPKKGGGLIDKTKRAMHRLGDKMRSAMHRKDKNTQTAAKGDTRSMGAAGSDTQDSGRQQRMDDAYASWKSKQK